VKLGLESSRAGAYVANAEQSAPASGVRLRSASELPMPPEEPARLPAEDRLSALAAEALRLEIEAGCLREKAARKSGRVVAA
jgi:hypothetical protein